MHVEPDRPAIELTITEVGPPHLPSAGDVRVEAMASMNGFVGRGHCWIDAETLASFAASFRRLSMSLDGIAELRSISPSEFLLSVSPADPPGSILVKVAISNPYPLPCSMTGSFEIELSKFSKLVSWVEGARVGSSFKV